MKETIKKNIYNLPLALIVFFVPLIVYLKKVPLSGVLAENWTSSTNMDFFSYYKMLCFVALTIVAVIAFIIYLHKEDKIRQGGLKYYIPLGVYAFFTFASTFLAEYPYASILGFPDRYEGLLVLLSYVLITIVTINLVKDKDQIKFMIIALLASATLLGIHGIFQYFGMDFFQTDMGRYLILPSEFHDLASNLNFNFGKQIIYSTMFNPNYVGSYTAMLFSLTMALYILVEKRWYKLGLGLINLIMFAYWLASVSRAGMLGAALALIMLFVILHKKVRENWQYLLAIGVCFILIFIILNDYGQGNIAGDLLSFVSQAKVTLGREENNIELEDIRTEDNRLVIESRTNTLVLKLIDGSFSFFDSQGQKLDYTFNKQERIIRFADKRYKRHNFVFNIKNSILKWGYGRIRAKFKITKEGFYIIGHNNKAYKIKDNIERWGFEGRERLGSSRGYIWSRSIPMLKDTLFLGYGADMYAIYFPQDDFVGKLKAWGSATKIVDKPHNMYLQWALNTGLPSLLAILVLFGIYFVQSIKLYWNTEFDDTYTIVGVGILAAFVGYAIAGLFNDSVVSVAPVFWILLGIGISINLQLSKRKTA